MNTVKKFRICAVTLVAAILLLPLGIVNAINIECYSINIDQVPHGLADKMARTILADETCLLNAIFTYSNVAQGRILSSLGIMYPTEGDTFVLISTGVAGAVPVTTNAEDPGSEHGTDFSGTYDFAELTLVLQVPDRYHYLYYDIQYFSTDYPEYTSGYIDKFTMTVDSPSQGTTEYVIDINSGDFVLNAYDIPDTGFDIFATSGDPAGRDDEVTTTPIQGSEDAGATAIVTREHPVSPNEKITVTFRIEDVGDNLLDSAVFIDNLMFSGYY